MKSGTVYLVGGGPGDPELLTVKGKWCLEHAEAIVYDRLVSPQLLTLASTEVQLYDVGKSAGFHTLPQRQIEHLLISLAKRGLTVVRLKGGDPFVFGRGGEEAQALTDAGVPWEVVPGVTSAVAVPAYAGIPLTYRDISSSFTVVTGHPATSASSTDWPALAKNNGTLVILMGVRTLSSIAQALMTGGMSGDTPAVAIQWGTRAAQRTETGCLGNIADIVRKTGLQAPAVLVVGNVATLRERLAWHEKRLLIGKRVLVAADTQREAAQIASVLMTQGAEVHSLSLEQAAKVCTGELKTVANAAVSAPPATKFQNTGIFFRTKLGVDLFFNYCRTQKIDFRKLAGVVFGVSNQRIAEQMEKYGIYAEGIGIVPPEGNKARHWWVERNFGYSGLENDSFLTQAPGSPDESEFSPFDVDESSKWISLARLWAENGQVDCVWHTTCGKIMADAVLRPEFASANLLEVSVEKSAISQEIATSGKIEDIIAVLARRKEGG